MYNLHEICCVIEQMDLHLRTALLKEDDGSVSKKKLWEYTYIRHQIDKRKSGDVFSINDHIRAMVYSMLSSGTSWKRLEEGIDIESGKIIPIDRIFCDYDVNQILQFKPEQLRDLLKEQHFASQYTVKQMQALLEVNIPKLMFICEQYHSIDEYYQTYIETDRSLKSLITTLSEIDSKNKLKQMDTALVCEYLRNVGYDVPKPDRHIRRILGRDILGCSDKEIVPVYEVFDIISAISTDMNKSSAEVDYILWSYCADGYGEICTKKNPKCSKCIASEKCEYGGKMNHA